MVIRREYHRAGREELRLAKRGGNGKTRRMKTSLDHLPLGKRRELEHVLGVIKDEFRKAIANRRAEGVKDGQILKVILYGSYARGDWVEDPVGRYFSDFDLLVVVSDEKLTDVLEFWEGAEKRLRADLASGANLRTPADLIIHSLDDVNDQLAHRRLKCAKSAQWVHANHLRFRQIKSALTDDNRVASDSTTAAVIGRLRHTIAMVAFAHCSIGESLSFAVGRASCAPFSASKLIDGLNESGWATSSVEGGEHQTIRALESLVDQLGVAVQGRGGAKIEKISPTSREQAYRRSLSAEHGLKPLPLHVELSHRTRPCRYVAFGCLDPGTPSVATAILDHRTMDFSAKERALLCNAVLLVRSGRRSFYSSILSASEPFLRFDRDCMEAIDVRGREAIDMVEDRLAQCSPVYHHWHSGDVLLLDNWRVLHGRASAEGSQGRRLSRVLING